MKICFIIPSMTGGGAERVTANLANRLDEMGHEAEVIESVTRCSCQKVPEHFFSMPKEG